MIRMKAHSLIALLVVAALMGCGKPEDKFVGKYDGKLEIPQESLDQIKAFATAAGATPAQVEQQIKEATFGMELMKEGKCRVWSASKGQESSNEATWTLNEQGNAITIKFKDPVAGTGVVPPDMGLTASEDKKTLTFHRNEMGMQVTVVYTKL